jgi:hypothetical protein
MPGTAALGLALPWRVAARLAQHCMVVQKPVAADEAPINRHASPKQSVATVIWTKERRKRAMRAGTVGSGSIDRSVVRLPRKSVNAECVRPVVFLYGASTTILTTIPSRVMFTSGLRPSSAIGS